MLIKTNYHKSGGGVVVEVGNCGRTNKVVLLPLLHPILFSHFQWMLVSGCCMKSLRKVSFWKWTSQCPVLYATNTVLEMDLTVSCPADYYHSAGNGPHSVLSCRLLSQCWKWTSQCTVLQATLTVQEMHLTVLEMDLTVSCRLLLQCWKLTRECPVECRLLLQWRKFLWNCFRNFINTLFLPYNLAIFIILMRIIVIIILIL